MTEKTKRWINDIASGKLSMSQRKTEGLIRLEGDLESIVQEARKKKMFI